MEMAFNTDPEQSIETAKALDVLAITAPARAHLSSAMARYRLYCSTDRYVAVPMQMVL